ncbi:MAG TPA: NEW3 domain-containing protein [Acidimicrobiia bacterium]|nr:NEW3 domain-containing protein [Acidimicrobiia bacterium]
MKPRRIEFMRKVTVTVALFIAVLSALATPLAAQTDTGQTETGLTLTTPYPGLTVEPGDTASFDLLLTATSTTTVDLSVDGVPDGWTANFRGGGFVVNQVTAGTDEAPDLTLSVIIPTGTADGSFPLTVSADSSGSSVTLAIEVVVQGGAGGTVTMTPEYSGVRGPSSETFTFPVDLRNDSPAEVQLELSAEGPIGWIVEARPQSQTQASAITIDPGATTRITVTANPSTTAVAGLYDLRVVARGGGVDAEVPLQVQITGSFDMQISTADQRLNADVTAGQATQFPVIVFNTGTADLVQVSLDSIPPSGWEVTWDTELIPTIAAGDFATVNATITPSTEAIAGDYQITFRASSDDANASMEVRTTVSPSAFGGLVGIGLILLTLAALAWVFRRFGRR